MKKVNPIIILSFLLLLFGCEEETEFASRSYPLIITQEASDITQEGATLNAKIVNGGYSPDFITDYGFIWNNDSEVFKYSIKNRNSIDDFTLRVNSDLKENTEYVFNAYIDFADKLIVSNPLKFNSQGSLPPHIDNIYPLEGFSGSLATVTGSGFSANPDNNIVTLAGVRAQLYYSSTDSLQFFVPNNNFTGETEIKISVGSKSTVYGSKFKIFGPEITGISKEQDYPGNLLTIYGKYFSNIDNKTELYFGSYLANILSVNENEIKTYIPFIEFSNLYQDKDVSIKLRVGTETIEYPYDFTIKTPWAKKPTFPSVAHNSQIFTYNSKAYLLEQSSNNVNIYNPETNEWTVESGDDFPKLTSNSLFIVVNDYVYLVGGEVSNQDPYQELWAYNIDSKTWNRKGDIPFNFKIGTFYMYNNTVYIITDKRGHWKCDFEKEEYTRLNDFPTNIIYSMAYSFVSNNKIFAGTSGFTYQYEPINDTWTEKSLLPVSNYGQHVQCFSLNDKGYIFDPQDRKLWRYDELNYQWELVSKVPDLSNEHEVSIFSLKNKAYFVDLKYNNIGYMVEFGFDE